MYTFLITCFLEFQVMYDASGVRLQAGRQAEVCARLLSMYF